MVYSYDAGKTMMSTSKKRYPLTMIRRSNKEICCYSYWYPQFKDIALCSVLIPLSEDVCDYLLEDSTLVLPQEACISVKKDAFVEQEGECLDDDDYDDTLEIKQPSFPGFSEALSQAVANLGGEVFVKLNWSAPVDAAWITSSKSLKCTSIEDIYLLLKSSDILAKELTYIKQVQSTSALVGCVVMKQWCDIYPGYEFRCFVINQKLVGISQRDYKAYYEYIAQNKFAIIEDIGKFFTKEIRGKFPAENYTFDIFRKPGSGIKIIDFGSEKTNSLLFKWEELYELGKDDSGLSSPEFRFLGEDVCFQPNPHQHYGLPQDFENLLDTAKSPQTD